MRSRRGRRVALGGLVAILAIVSCFDWEDYYGKASLELTGPNGGGTWEVGTEHEITWESENLNHVCVELSRDGGETWEVIAPSVKASSGSFAWVVTGPASGGCLIRVSDADYDLASATIPAPFTVKQPPQSLELISPNGDENWEVGSEHQITWSSEGIVSVRIECSLDGGATWLSVVQSTYAHSGSYTWQVPGPTSDGCLLKISDIEDSQPSDCVDAAFVVSGGSWITVTSPDGGEVWRHNGPEREVTWLSGGIAGNMDVDYSTDGGASWRTVAAGSANSGSCEWTLPDVESSRCLVRVQEAGGGAGDQSDGEFTIAPVQSARFLRVRAGLVGCQGSAVVWGDYDNDGDLDLAVAGRDNQHNVAQSAVYRNDGNGIFVDIDAAIPKFHHAKCSLAWGDFDADGDIDLLTPGKTSSGYVCNIYRNDGADSFTEIEPGIPERTANWCCGVAWGDYDNDGDLDIVASGPSWETAASDVYRNDGNGLFASANLALPGLASTAVGWGDCDNDGDLDVALAGSTDGMATGAMSWICRNEEGVFANTETSVQGVWRCSLDWGDYDADGDIDLVLAGSFEDTEWFHVTKVYRNDAGGFTDIGAGLVGVDMCGVAWADFDGDGDLDIAVSGSTGTTSQASRIYRNRGGDVFSDIDAGLLAVCWSSLAWGDYDGDGDVDLVVAGGRNDLDSAFTTIYQNLASAPNGTPNPPDGLSASSSGSEPCDVSFSWNPAWDAETPSPGLSYNLRVGTAPGMNDVMPGMAIIGGPMDGRRLIPAMGNVQHNTSWTLKGLGPGRTYYWSVQAIDTCFAGSLWAPEQAIVVP